MNREIGDEAQGLLLERCRLGHASKGRAGLTDARYVAGAKRELCNEALERMDDLAVVAALVAGFV